MQAGMGSVAGIGVDLLRVGRIERAYVRHGARFSQRILGEQELEKFERRYRRDARRGIRFLASRFAAKEAFSKAIGLGMRMPMTWTRMQTLNDPTGKPSVSLNGPLAAWYALRFGAAHVSITDDQDMVLAFVIVEKRQDNCLIDG